MRACLCSCVMALVACSSPLSLQGDRALIGPEGGSVALADGAQIDIPPGALNHFEMIRIASYDSLPPDGTFVAVSRAYTLEPQGLEFATPIYFTLPFDESMLPPGSAGADVVVLAETVASSCTSLTTTQDPPDARVSAMPRRASRFWAAVLPPQGCHGKGTAGRSCNDGDLCTYNDVCTDDSTCAGLAYQCDDGDPCTADECDGLGGCVHFAVNGPPCENTDPCAINNGGCDPLTTCINSPGGRTCGACPGGYSGTGASGCHVSGTLVLFFGGYLNGNLGGRAGVDALCASMAPVGISWAKGLISVDAGDLMRDVIPIGLQGLPVQTVYGEQLATNWQGLFDGSIDRDLIPVVGASGWWTGATSTGGLGTYTCDGWTSSGDTGSLGCGGMSDAHWLDCSAMLCSETSGVACVGYNELTTPLKTPWCPPDSLYYALGTPGPGWGCALTLSTSGGHVGPDGYGCGAGQSTPNLSACNLVGQTTSLRIEMRGADCLDCPVVFAAVAGGQCGTVNCSATSTGLIELCVSVNP